MEQRARVIGVVAMLSLGLGGCAVIATHDEYASYRRIRLTRDDSERIRALAEYAQRYPSGLWIDEVRRERRAREDEVWARHNSTREGLQYYLSVYPDGRFVELAQQRLAAVTTVAARRQEEQQRVQELHEERREQAAVERRLWVTRAVQFWARTLLGIRNYGSPIGQVARANPEFSEAFGQRPEPLCTPQACIKHYRAHYVIPVPGATRIDREIHLFLRILLDRGRVERIEVLLPNKGFSRWYELENRTVVTDEDPAQRQAALEWALQRIEPVIAEVAPTAQAIDHLPETIAPISAAEQAQSARAGEADTQVPGEPRAADVQRSGVGTSSATSAGSPAGGSAGSAGDGSTAGESLEELLAQAIGGGGVDANAPATQTPPADEETVPSVSLVLPIGLRALQIRNVRVVIFAAGDEDYGEAYDGFYIERVRD
jgi:hypothetical protein